MLLNYEELTDLLEILETEQWISQMQFDSYIGWTQYHL